MVLLIITSFLSTIYWKILLKISMLDGWNMSRNDMICHEFTNEPFWKPSVTPYVVSFWVRQSFRHAYACRVFPYAKQMALRGLTQVRVLLTPNALWQGRKTWFASSTTWWARRNFKFKGQFARQIKLLAEMLQFFLTRWCANSDYHLITRKLNLCREKTTITFLSHNWMWRIINCRQELLVGKVFFLYHDIWISNRRQEIKCFEQQLSL